MFNVTEKVPTDGYILPLWNRKGAYRATALAYMKREIVKEVEHYKGRWYTLNQIESAIIGKH